MMGSRIDRSYDHMIWSTCSVTVTGDSDGYGDPVMFLNDVLNA